MDVALQKSSDVMEKIRQSVISKGASVEESNVDVASIDVTSMPLMDKVHMNNKTPLLSNMLGHAMYTGLVIPSIPEQNIGQRRRSMFDEPPRKFQSIFNPADQFRHGEDYRRVPTVSGGGNW
jgi:hypothetical protein